MPVIKTSRLMLREVCSVYCENHTKHALWVKCGVLLLQLVMHVDTTGLYSVNMLTFPSSYLAHCSMKV
jgi:hypothetical protein